MFDRLDDLLIRYEELMSELQEPDVANDANRFRKLMKEQADLAPLVEAYTEYKNAKQAIVDSEEMLELETDEEMRELAKEDPQYLHDAPHNCLISRPDEVEAARKPILRYEFGNDQ